MAIRYRGLTRHRLTPWRLAVSSILALLIAVRLYRLTERYVWTDELFVMRFVTDYSLLELLYRIPIEQPHLPLYYIIVDVGHSVAPLVWLRGLSVIGSLVGLAVLVAVARTRLEDSTTAVVGVLFALAPPSIAAGRWLRPYGLLIGAVAVSWWLFIHVDERAGARTHARYYLATVAAVMLHPLAALVPISQLTYRPRRDSPALPLTVVAGIGGTAFVVGKLTGVLGSINQLHHTVTPTLIQIIATPGGLVTGRMWLPVLTWTALLLGGVAAIGALAPGASTTRRLGLAWFGVPFLGVIAASTIHPVLGIKYLTWTLPGFLLLVGRGLEQLPQRVRWTVMVVTVTATATAALVYLNGGWSGARIAIDYTPPLW